MKSLVTSLDETLSFHPTCNKHPTILTDKILEDNELESMLSTGLHLLLLLLLR
ncbi:hypothetical protein [Bacillus sp. SRB3LM]|uniref:hypothetical protein n=1 Tax=Bacillus sp. SRB3LM TaxID=2608689 RepID=UPI001E48B9F6|nr:hypothetical protein [Bacillus sp. SRB3LM]